MKCSGDSEILHEKVCDTKRKSGKHELIRVISRTISCSILESQLHFISFSKQWIDWGRGIAKRAVMTALLVITVIFSLGTVLSTVYYRVGQFCVFVKFFVWHMQYARGALVVLLSLIYSVLQEKNWAGSNRSAFLYYDGM